MDKESNHKESTGDRVSMKNFLDKKITMADVMSSTKLFKIRVGKRIQGTIIDVSEERILVDIHFPKDGFIAKNEVCIDAYNPENFKEGDILDVIVIPSNENSKYINLSSKKAEEYLFEEAKVKEILAGSEFALSKFEVVKGGLIGKMSSYTIFVPASEIRIGYVSDLGKYKDKTLRLRAKPEREKTDSEGKQRRRNAKRIVASQKIILEEEAKKAANDAKMLAFKAARAKAEAWSESEVKRKREEGESMRNLNTRSTSMDRRNMLEAEKSLDMTTGTFYRLRSMNSEEECKEIIETLDFNLKLEYSDKIDEDIIYAIPLNEVKSVKLTSNKPWPEKDRKDERFYSSIGNTKMVFPLEEGCLILVGKLGCSFSTPFGGSFYIHRANVVSSADFDQMKGYPANVIFSKRPIEIRPMEENLAKLMESDRFVFNIEQFEDFMEIFEFYKSLADELNNSATYEVRYSRKPYNFISVETKNIYGEDGELLPRYEGMEEVKNGDGLIIGYIVEQHLYESMPNSIADNVASIIDIHFKYDKDRYKKVKKMRDNLYLSDYKQVNKKNCRELKHLTIQKINKDDDSIIISAISDKEYKDRYLNLYDMGQKIKIESIEDSLKLINQGNTGNAIELIEYLIGDKPIPPSTNNIIVAEQYTRGLNKSQIKAFQTAIDGSPITLIKGPPGTGKTHVINAITQYITKELKEKVVISSQTHVAIDNVLDKLMANNDIIIPNRITNRKNKYSGEEIDKTLYKTWGAKFQAHNKLARNKELANAVEKNMQKFAGKKCFKYSNSVSLSDYSVIGATTTTSAIGGKKGSELFEDYKWLIIDEVSKCPITEVLRYLPYIDKIIMVGDNYQLAPLLEFKDDDVKNLSSYDKDRFEQLKKVYESSVFADTMKKAEEAGRLVLLEYNYRSVKAILEAYNVFYDGQLKGKREEVNPKTITISKNMGCISTKDAVFVEVKGGSEQQDGHSKYNMEEIGATASILRDLIKYTDKPAIVTVSAIFPYAAQISRFTKRHKDLINQARKTFKTFDVDTVDAFQGKESDIVLVNTVVTSSTGNFLKDFRRINVSMSRAKDKLIIFGNSIVLSKIEMKIEGGEKKTYFKQIIEDIKRAGAMIEYNKGKQVQGGVSYEDKRTSKIKLR